MTDGLAEEYRRRDLRLTLVMLGLLATPAWLTPAWFARPWLIATVVLAGPALWLSWRHAPWVPTPMTDLEPILSALAVQQHERFCDLGAGDGRMVVRVHEATGAHCTGIEGVPVLFLIGWLRSLGRDCRMKLGDLRQADLTEYDVLYLWGTSYGSGTASFSEHLRDRTKPGTRVVCYHTPLHGLQPTTVDDDGTRPIYSYVLHEWSSDPVHPAKAHQSC